MYRYLIVIIASLLVSCSQKKHEDKLDESRAGEKNERKIDSVSVYFYNYIRQDEKAVGCGEIQITGSENDELNRTVLSCKLTDTPLLDVIASRIDSLRPSASSAAEDIRISAKISYNNNTSSMLCIGGMYSDLIFLDGILQETDNKLLFMLKNNIGYYPWMIGDALMNMSELKDNSFPKEPFKSSPQYEEYQQRSR